MAATGSPPRWCYRIGGRLYAHVTSRCNTVSLVASRGPGFKPPWKPSVDREPTADEMIAELQAELKRESASPVIFAGHGEPTLALDIVLAAGKSLMSLGVPIRLNTNGLACLEHGRDVFPDLKAAGITSISVALNSADPEKFALQMRPKVQGLPPAKAFEAACDFVRTGAHVLGSANVEVTCVESPGVDMSAVQGLSDTLGAGVFRSRSYCRLAPSADFPMHQAAFAGDANELATCTDPDAKDDHGNTLLVWAAESGHTGLINMLVQERKCDVNAVGKSGNAPLHRAASRGHVSAVHALLALRAHPSAYNAKMQTPLHHAAFYQHPSCVKVLLEGSADATLKDGKGRCPEDDTASEEVRTVFKNWPDGRSHL